MESLYYFFQCLWTCYYHKIESLNKKDPSQFLCIPSISCFFEVILFKQGEEMLHHWAMFNRGQETSSIPCRYPTRGRCCPLQAEPSDLISQAGKVKTECQPRHIWKPLPYFMTLQWGGEIHLKKAELSGPVREPMKGQVRVMGLLGTNKLAGHLADPERPMYSAVWGWEAPGAMED